MSLKTERVMIKDGIYLTTIVDEKFKSNNISIRFIKECDEKTASAYSLATSIALNSNKKCPTVTKLTQQLARLYGASVSKYISKIGDSQSFYIGASCICDKYAFEKEKVTSLVTGILLDCIFEPNVTNEAFDKSEFTSVRADIIDGIKAKINEKRSYAIDRAIENACEGEGASVLVDGSVKELEKLDEHETYKYFVDLIKTARIEISLSGGGDFEEVTEKIRTAFSNIDRDYKDFSVSNVSKPRSEVKRVDESFDVLQCKSVMVYKTDNRDFEANKLFSALYGGTPSSKLFMNVREKLSLCYYCAANVSFEKGIMIVDSGIEEQNVKVALDEIQKQLDEIKSGNFSEDDLVNAKLAVCGATRTIYDTASSLSQWFIVKALNNDIKTPDEAIERYMQITKEDIINVANSYKLDTVYIMNTNGGAR